MIARHDTDGVHYRSRGGVVAFALWCLLILAGVVFVAWSAAANGEPPWFVVAAFAGILVLGLYSTSLDVTLTHNGHLVFRGLLRRQAFPSADLRAVRPGSFCIVFTFKRGRAMVASSNRENWLALGREVKRRNPHATLNLPGMFRMPFEPAEDDEQ
jgi:hypothetical protein